MDWLNTQFYRDFGYGLVYPQLFPHHKRRSDEAHAGAIAWGSKAPKTGCRSSTITGSDQKTCISAATNSRSPIISAPDWCRSGELVGCDLAAYPNIKRWLDNMRKLKSWDQVNDAFNGFVCRQ
jgi:glutathione S-transferase